MHLPPDARRIVLGYLGETVREPLVRLIEHVMDQPWADTIVGYDVDPRVFVGKAAVLEAEEAAIRSERPLYNVVHNEGGHRIPPPLAIRQRRARDAAKADARRWVHPDDRGVPARAQPAPVRVVSKHRWSSRRKHLTGLGGVNALLTPAVWITLAVRGVWFPAAWWLVPAIAVVMSVWVWSGCPVTRAGRRRAWRRVKRRLTIPLRRS
jgi:hypothetical protein